MVLVVLVLFMGDTVEVRANNLGGESILEAPVKVLKKVRDFVSKGEVIFILETDKTSLEIVAPVSGVVQSLLVADDDVVTKGQTLAVISEQDAEPQKDKIVEPEGKTKSEGETKSEDSIGTQGAAKVEEAPKSPEAEQKRSMSKFSPTAPDVENFIAGAGVSPSSRASGKCGSSGAGSAPSNVGNSVERKSGDVPGERRVKMSKIRQVIAARLKESQNVAATLSTFNEVDMSAVMAVRAKYKDTFIKKHDVKLGFMSFFIRAVVLACAEIPVLNAEIRGDEIIYRDYCNIGVAVGTDKGLVVPVIRAAESMSLAELEQKLVELSTLARGGKLAVSDMSGATFTITNGGVYGSLLSTPIINPPQSGILGMHAIQERPVVVEGKIEIRPMMYIALSYDHRIVDGQGAVTFLVRVKQYIEDPTRMTLMV